MIYIDKVYMPCNEVVVVVVLRLLKMYINVYM